MKRLLIGLVISIPSLAFAQPGMTPPIGQPPTNQPDGQTPPTGLPPIKNPDHAPERTPIQVPIGQPPPAPGDTPLPEPNLPPPPPGGPPGPNWTPKPMVGSQPLGYAPGYGPDYTNFGPPPGLAQYRHGVTFEAGLGLGAVWANSDNDSSDRQGGASVALGLGGWATNHLALSARLIGTSFSETDGLTEVLGFFGPNLQYYFDDHVFLGGGVGWSTFSVKYDDRDTQPDGITGLGVDLRFGYNFVSRSPNTFNIALEWTTGFFHPDSDTDRGISINSFSIMAGYQHL